LIQAAPRQQRFGLFREIGTHAPRPGNFAVTSGTIAPSGANAKRISFASGKLS
jgi:hypothetical protein